MDGGAWWAAVHGVARSRTQLSVFTFTFHFHALEKEMATHSSVLAWRIPGTGEPGVLPVYEVAQSRTRLKRLSSSSSSIKSYTFSKNNFVCLVAQLGPTLCDPMDGSPSGSSVHEILQARILEWVAISFSRGCSWPRDWTQIESSLQADSLTSEPPFQ